MCLLVPNQAAPCVHQICQRLQQFIEDSEIEQINKQVKISNLPQNQLQTLEVILKDLHQGILQDKSNNNCQHNCPANSKGQTQDTPLKFPSDFLNMTQSQLLNCNNNASKCQSCCTKHPKKIQDNTQQSPSFTLNQNNQLLRMIYGLLDQQNQQAQILFQLQHQQQNIEFSMVKLVDEIQNINKQFVVQNWIQSQQQQQQSAQKQINFIQNSNFPIQTNQLKNEKIDEHEPEFQLQQFGFSQQKTQLTVPNTKEIVNPEDLIECFYNQQHFQYKLTLKSELECPLYRERNFKIQIELQNNQNKTIFNQNKIGLGVALYTCENPPKLIELNMNGQKVFKGKTEKILFNGQASFEKIHIKEVTSHFRNGWVFIVVYPKQTFNSQNDQTHNIIEQIDYKLIKPLVIEKVQIKAKKISMKNKLQNKYQEKFQNNNNSLNSNNDADA